MSTKGITMALATRKKISLANTKDRAKIDQAIKDYILTLDINDIPLLTDAANHAGISEKTLIRYEMQTEDDSEIRTMLDFIRDMQKSRLIKGGLKRGLDGRLVALLLERTHGMRSDPQSLSQTNIFNGITPDILADALELTRNKAIKDNK